MYKVLVKQIEASVTSCYIYSPSMNYTNSSSPVRMPCNIGYTDCCSVSYLNFKLLLIINYEYILHRY